MDITEIGQIITRLYCQLTYVHKTAAITDQYASLHSNTKSDGIRIRSNKLYKSLRVGKARSGDPGLRPAPLLSMQPWLSLSPVSAVF